VIIPAQQRPRTRALTLLAWALCILSVTLALASVALAGFNGENLLELVANHHAIGILNALVLPLIGALIVVGDRHHLLAWLLILAGASLAVYNLAAQYAPLALGLTSRRLSLAGGDLAAWLTSWTNVPGIVILAAFLILLFPDGRPPSRRWRPVAWAGAVILVVPTAILAIGYWPLRGPELITQEGSQPALVGAMFWTAFQGALLLGAISVVALVLRFRRAGALQRQQIKWFAYGAALSIPLSLFPEARPWGPYLEFLGTVLLLAGLGIGILRYRLWDIDRLVNRTLVYGLLTAVLGAVYAGLVLVLGQLFGGIGTETPSWAVAGATLAVAALFQPARRRIQQTVDRRFNRRKYNAAKTIEAFSIRLRDQVDLDTLSAELLAAVDQTMQPASASLWLRPSA
jgi:MFS family permease